MIRVLLNIDIHTSSMSALVCLCIGTRHDFNASEYLGIAKIVGTESVRIVVSAFFFEAKSSSCSSINSWTVIMIDAIAANSDSHSE